MSLLDWDIYYYLERLSSNRWGDLRIFNAKYSYLKSIAYIKSLNLEVQHVARKDKEAPSITERDVMGTFSTIKESEYKGE